MATHNGERFVEEQVRSILDQTLPPTEVLVGDDASSDRTVPILETVGATHPLGDRIRIVRRSRALGVVGNFEDLLSQATGDFVALADQDDRWRAIRMELLVSRLESEPELLLLHHDAELVDATSSTLGGLFESLRIGQEALDDERQGRGFERLLRRNLVTGATVVMRRSLMSLAGPVPAGWIHDEWLAIAAAAVNGLGVDEQRLIDYRQHGGNQIGVRRLDLRQVISRFREDGIERDRRLLMRAESLADALERIPGVTDERRRLAAEKVLHELRRTALPVARWQRIGPAADEWRSGRYVEFGNGAADLVRDLVQPRRGALS